MRGLYTEKVAPGKIPFGRLVREILEPGAGEAVSSRIREIDPTQDAYGRTSDVREPIRKADATDADEAAFLLGQIRETDSESRAEESTDAPETENTDILAERFCDDGEGEVNRYNVYKITTEGKCYVLKKSDEAEIGVYERFLKGQGLPAPDYFGSARWGGKRWILIEYVPGTDLRDYTSDMALPCAESISRIANRYWQEDEAAFVRKKRDDRFERYWKRINKRAECLKGEPVLKEA